MNFITQVSESLDVVLVLLFGFGDEDAICEYHEDYCDCDDVFNHGWKYLIKC